MKRGERGFSLIEMLVALTVTLLVTGAIYKLVTAGQGAFRREPALADRQQNIRAAMDIINQDVLRAGFGLPRFVQVFTASLNGAGPLGSSGQATDELELIEGGNCASQLICKTDESGWVVTKRPTSCFRLPGALLFANGAEWRLLDVVEGTDASLTCGSGTNGTIKLADEDHTACDSFTSGCPLWVMDGALVHYRIRADASHVPNLERSANGNAGPWEIVARGIEDLQVQYRRGVDEDCATGCPKWEDDPGAVVSTNNPDEDIKTLVWRVRVELGARVVGEQNLAGQTRSAVDTGGVSQVRGRLATEIAPRAAQAFVASIRKES